MLQRIVFSSAFALMAITVPAQKETLDSTIKKTVLLNVYKTIQNNYVFPDKAEIIINYIQEQDRNGQYLEKNSPRDFADALTKSIRMVEDNKHLRIIYDPKLEKDIVAFVSSKQGARQIAINDSIKDESHNYYFKKIEVLPSNIGYIEFTNFAVPNASARKTVRAAMQFVSHTDALIIDLRNNFGGNTAMADEILSYFFSTKTFTGRTFNKIENKWSDQFIENKKDVTGGLVMNMPIYILTSRRTFSAAEGLAYTLQQFKKATIIGDTTRGGAHLTRSFSVDHGFVAFVPYLRTENAKTKTDFEGKGVMPDIRVEASKALVQAQKAALKHKQANTKDDTQKRKIAWLIHYYQAQTEPVEFKASDYENATGRFAEFEITIRDSQLLFRDVNQRTAEYRKMIAITTDLFQVGGDYQVALIKDERGNINSIKVFWEDGWSEIINRTK